MKGHIEMKTKTTNLRSAFALTLAVSLVLSAVPALAQGGNSTLKTNTRILYHNGPVMTGTSDIYLIWYGDWGGVYAVSPLTDLVGNIGSSPYFKINTSYTNAEGSSPSGGLIYGGTIFEETYSHGNELGPLAIQEIVTDAITAEQLPLDPAGIYVVLASPDISSNSTGFCTPNTPPHHGTVTYLGTSVKYAFIGNPLRCPTSAAPQLVGVPTPNGDFAADGIASTLAAVLSAIVTNPTGSGWFDRYGLENSTKCLGTFGETYTNVNGARANMKIGQRDWLIQQNWVNSARKGYCALSLP